MLRFVNAAMQGRYRAHDVKYLSKSGVPTTNFESVLLPAYPVVLPPAPVIMYNPDLTCWMACGCGAPRPPAVGAGGC